MCSTLYLESFGSCQFGGFICFVHLEERDLKIEHHLHNCSQDSIATLLGGGQDPVRLIVVLPAHRET